jgi:hypothetical protein
MQNRIDRLEGLVLSLMSGNETRTMSMSTNSQGVTPEREEESETDSVAKSFGVLHFNNNKAMYIGDSHWATILTEISEVKNYFSDHKKQYEDAMRKVEASRKQAGIQYTGPAFLIGCRNKPEFSELLASLPGRDAVDKLVQRYFNDYDPATHILHIPSWQKQYDKHWQSPENTTPAFLGQLFAICGLAMQSYFKNQDEPYEYRGRSQSLSSNYRTLTQQCLLLLDFSKPEHTAIETMILHLHSEFLKTGEADIGIWIFTGMIVRFAMRMGMHRDSKNFPHINPFQGEMRRRLWNFIRHSDILVSFAIGLPNMIRSTDTDTELPANLKDEDFDEDTQMMPSPRPKTEFTAVSYLIAKSELAAIFGRIAETTQGVNASPYEDILKLDTEIRDAYHSTFPVLHMKSPEESQLDPATTLTMRMNISLLYNKGLCVLHRRYVTRARENSRYAPSRQACIDASMQLLRNQQILEVESQPGKRMHRSQYHISSVMTHDFILAATLVSLDLFYSVQAEASGRSTGDIEMWGHDRKEEMMQAVESARNIWDGLKDRYLEAYKAYTICGLMLQKIQQIRAQTAANMARGAFQYAAATEEKPEHSAAITLGMLSSGGNNEWKSDGPYPLTPQSNTQTGLTPNFPIDMTTPSPFSFFNGVNGDVPTHMDWVSFSFSNFSFFGFFFGFFYFLFFKLY